MHKYLKGLMVCPKCKNELAWSVHEENASYIVNAEMSCPACGQHYFVEDRVGNFLIDYKKKEPVEERDRETAREFFEKYSEQMKALLLASNDALNAADLSLLRDYYIFLYPNPTSEQRELIDETERRFRKEYYAGEYGEADNLTMRHICDLVKDETGFILDIASGGGGLVCKLLENANADVIASDISDRFQVAYQDLPEEQKSRLTILSFDAAASPFRDNSVSVMTSRVGFSNISVFTPIMDALTECHRMSNGMLYAQETFFPEDDAANLIMIKEYSAPRSDEFSKADTGIAMLKEAGFRADFQCRTKAVAPKRPESAFIPHNWLDMLPIADTVLEYGVIVASKK